MRRKPIQLLIAVSAVSCALCLFGLLWTLQEYTAGAPAAAPVVAGAANGGGTGSGLAGAETGAGGQGTDTAAGAASLGGGAATPVPPARTADGTLDIVALGDSLTRGNGDPEGKGYPGYAADELEAQPDTKVKLTNLGVDGLTAPQLATMLKQDNVKRAVPTADAVVISIGGNDLFQGGRTLANMNEQQIADLRTSFNKQLAEILVTVRQLNAGAPIYVMGLYNPFSSLGNAAAATNQIVRDWNEQLTETVAATDVRTVFVPVYDLFQLNVQELLHTDQFHPNGKGYRLMGERLAALIARQGGGG